MNSHPPYRRLFRLNAVGVMVSIALSLFSAPAWASTWTVLLYMAADNDLWDEGLRDLAELQEIGSTPEVKVIVQADIKGSTVQRLLLERGRARLIRDMGELDSGDPEVLADFGVWGVLRYPSQHYLLVVWDHGNGWFNEIGTAVSQGPAPPAVHAGIAYDGSSGNSIGVANGELRGALLEIASHLGRTIDVLGLDACSMQLLEVACEMRDAAQILVASQALVPLDGWPYSEILSILTASPDLSPESLAVHIVRAYVDSYENGSQGTQDVTLSALDLSNLEGVRETLEHFSVHLSQRTHDPFIQAAREEVQSFYMGICQPFLAQDYVDLADFATLIRAGSSGELEESTRLLESAVYSSVICSEHCGHSVENAYGMSIWYPEEYIAFINNHLEYKGLDLAKRTSWEEFLYRYYGVPDTIPPTTPEISSMRLLSANSFMVRWEESYDLSGVSSYELREISEPSSLLRDDCEGSTGNWNLYGFYQSQGNYHSPSRSYFSHQGEMLSREQFYPISGGELVFWCCYRGRQGSDILYVEISGDGSEWFPLGSVTGTEPDWVRKRYDLSPNASAGIYLRFRFESDGAPERWVYVDDIEVVSFGSSRTLSANIETNCFPVSARPRGEYHYRVRATDPFGNSSAWSDYEAIRVPGLPRPYCCPNPFSEGTHFALENPTGAAVAVRVYNLAGSLVRELRGEGETIFWDGRVDSGEEAPSGVYLFGVQIGSDRKTGKAVCLR